MPSLAAAWLRARGRFFADAESPGFETSLWFDGRSGVLYRIHSDEFRAFLSTATGVNREDKAFRFVASLVDDLALDAAETPRVVPAKQWTRGADGAVYLSCGDSEMYRVTAGRVERVQNGTDGVVFVRGSTLAPWRLLPGPGADPFSESLLFRCASLESEADRMNCRLWFLNLFACHANKPILLATGPARSGKTRLLQGMKQFLGLREDGRLDDSVMDVDPTDKGLDAFWVLVDRERFAVFDNLDSKVKWAENAFQTAATDGSCKRRRLYSDSGMVTFRANAHVAVTSNNPVFTTGGGGLPDRIVTVRVASGRAVSLGSELKEDILARRDEYMTWTARTLAAALADEAPVAWWICCPKVPSRRRTRAEFRPRNPPTPPPARARPSPPPSLPLLKGRKGRRRTEGRWSGTCRAGDGNARRKERKDGRRRNVRRKGGDTDKP